MRRTLRLLCAAVCLALALTACGQPVPDPVPTATPVPTPTQTPQALRFSLGYDPAAQLHPITGDSQVNQELTGLVYQGLYELDNAFQPQPVLAASGAPSEDGYIWTFTIRAGALFSDGSPLTAQHAAASLNAARTSTLYAARLSGVASVSAADELTLVVALSAPNGSLPALLDIPVVLEQEEGPPLGSGCYRYEIAGERLFLQTNPYHEGAAALPYATIPLTAVSDAAQRIAAFDSGSITAVTTDFSSPYALGYASSYEACDYPTTSLLYVGFQAAGGPCQSPLVRRAFSQVLDRTEVAEVLLSGHADPAALPVSPLSDQYDETAAQTLHFDLESAAALLEEAGYTKNEEDGLLYYRRTPLAVTLLVNSDNDTRQALAGQLTEALAQLGVTVTVSRLPWNDYVSSLSLGQVELYIGEVRLPGDFDPSALLTGNLNYGRYENWELTQALAAWRAAQGEDKIQAAQVLWEQFVQSAPFSPLCFKRGSLLVRWGLASNLQPTRANPFYRVEEWTTAANS